MFVRAVFETIELKRRSRLNFKVATSKIFSYLLKFGCQPQKSKADLCMRIAKFWGFFVLFIVPQRLKEGNFAYFFLS